MLLRCHAYSKDALHLHKLFPQLFMHAKQQPKASFFFVNPKVMVKTFCLYFIIGGVHCIHYKGYGSLPRRPSYLHFQFYLFPSFQREECLAPLHFTPKPIYQFARGEVERGCRPWTQPSIFQNLLKCIIMYYCITCTAKNFLVVGVSFDAGRDFFRLSIAQ